MSAHAGRIRHAASRHGEGGQALLLTVAFTSFLLMVGLLAVNIGVLVASRTSAQRAADAGVLAGCAELPDQGAASSMAVNYAANVNTHTGMEAGNTASTSFSSTGPPGPTHTIRVRVDRDQKLIGYASLGIASASMNAQAACTRYEGSRPALLALGGGPGQLYVHGGANLKMNDNGLAVASSSPSGLVVDGGATVQGKYLDTASGSASISGTVDPPVTKALPQILVNPFAAVPVPVLGGTIDIEPTTLTVPGNPLQQDPRPGCQGTSHIAPADTSPANPQHCHFEISGTLNPGIYWGGLELGNQSGLPTTITLNPGLYFLAGGSSFGSSLGGLRIWPKTTVVGNGVVFYNGADPFATDPLRRLCGTIRINQNTGVQLTPPATGVYAGLLFMQDPSCAETVQIDEGAAVGLPAGSQGALYIPSGEVSFTDFGSNTATMMRAIVVAQQIELQNNAQVTFDVFIPSGTVIHGAFRLVE